MFWPSFSISTKKSRVTQLNIYNLQEIHLLKYNKNFCQLNVSVFLQKVFMAFWSAFLTWLVNCLDQSTENHWKSLLMDFRFFSFYCIYLNNKTLSLICDVVSILINFVSNVFLFKVFFYQLFISQNHCMKSFNNKVLSH